MVSIASTAVAAEPWSSVQIKDAQGRLWHGAQDGQGPSAVPFEKAANSVFFEARLGKAGLEIRDTQGRYLIAVEGSGISFDGQAGMPETLFKLVRHYDGKVSLMSYDQKYVVIAKDGSVGREEMSKPSKLAVFGLSEFENGQPSLAPKLDCKPSTIKEIRKRYGKVANNGKLKTKVVSSEAEHEYYQKTTHRFYKGRLGEVHVNSGHSSGEADLYTYFWQSDVPYFEYLVQLSHATDIKEEIRRYRDQGVVCRCLYREIDVYGGAKTASPNFQLSCKNELVTW